MKLQLKLDKKYSESQKALPSQYINYLIKPKQFIEKLTVFQPKNLNPLYSKQSFTKYFDRKKPKKYKQPTQEFVMKKDNSLKTSPSIMKFNQLKEKIRKESRKGYRKKLQSEVQNFATQLQKQFQHFENLNWDDGIFPLNQFSLTNFKLKYYIHDLNNPKINSKFWRYQKARTHRQRIHTQNIVQYIKKQQYQSRYKTVPKTAEEMQQKKQLKSWERQNQNLRSKTMFCRTQYQPPFLKKEKLNAQILSQSRQYMSKKAKQSAFSTIAL